MTDDKDDKFTILNKDVCSVPYSFLTDIIGFFRLFYIWPLATVIGGIGFDDTENKWKVINAGGSSSDFQKYFTWINKSIWCYNRRMRRLISPLQMKYMTKPAQGSALPGAQSFDYATFNNTDQNSLNINQITCDGQLGHFFITDKNERLTWISIASVLGTGVDANSKSGSTELFLSTCAQENGSDQCNQSLFLADFKFPTSSGFFFSHHLMDLPSDCASNPKKNLDFFVNNPLFGITDNNVYISLVLEDWATDIDQSGKKAFGDFVSKYAVLFVCDPKAGCIQSKSDYTNTNTKMFNTRAECIQNGNCENFVPPKCTSDSGCTEDDVARGYCSTQDKCKEKSAGIFTCDSGDVKNANNCSLQNFKEGKCFFDRKTKCPVPVIANSSSKKKTLLIIGIIVLIVLGILSYFLFLRKKKKR